jgi:uncharacterized glyoxalase superfamily protein PhnB
VRSFYTRDPLGKLVNILEHKGRQRSAVRKRQSDARDHINRRQRSHGADIPHAEPTRSAYLTLNLDGDSEAERVFSAPANGGQVFTPMQETFFASSYGRLRDRFGIN